MKPAGVPAPPPPPEAQQIFGERLDLAERYAGLLASEATARGLIGPGEVLRLWSRHLLNCAVLAELIPTNAAVLDVGSGAGLPGVPLAIARPDLTVTLVEPLLRRSSWLDDIVVRLDLGQVTVIRSRAEDLHGQLSSPVVTARAVAPMERLARWCLPLVQPGGELLAMKGQAAEQELFAATESLKRLGAVSWDLVTVGAGRLTDTTSVARVRVGTAASSKQQRPRGRGRTT